MIFYKNLVILPAVLSFSCCSLFVQLVQQFEISIIANFFFNVIFGTANLIIVAEETVAAIFRDSAQVKHSCSDDIAKTIQSKLKKNSNMQRTKNLYMIY